MNSLWPYPLDLITHNPPSLKEVDEEDLYIPLSGLSLIGPTFSNMSTTQTFLTALGLPTLRSHCPPTTSNEGLGTLRL